MYRSATLAALCVALFAGADWTRFRGPDGSGVSTGTPVPTTWSADENVVWKTPLPGFGSSSPIALGDRIFLTCYSGYALDPQEPGDQEKLRLHLLCLDRATGKILWDETSEPELPETEFDRGRISLHGYASSTPVTDGDALYVFFGKSGVYKYGLDGKLLWHTKVGSTLDRHNWGSAASPILHDGLVIVNASIESESVRALNKETGEEVWRVDDIPDSWSTPLVVELPDGNKELVVSRHSQVLGLDPNTGEQLWKCAGVLDYVCPSVIAHKGIVYITGGRKPLTVAIRAGGRGDVTDTHRIWDLAKCSKVPTPLYHDGLLYWVCNKGIAVCVDAETGEVQYEERLDLSGSGDKVYASIVAADGKIFAVSRESGTVVLAAGPKFEVLARNSLDDTSIFNATPAVSNGQLFLKSDKTLYCIAEGFRPLFNGKDLTGWVNVNLNDDTFSVRDGVIYCTGKPTGVMRTDRHYENFILELEWRHLRPKGNAGLFIWSDAKPVSHPWFTRSIEVQILDGRETPNYTSHGDVFSIHGAKMTPDRPHPSGWPRCLPSEKRCNPSPEWNHYRVTCNEGAIQLAVNGKVVSGGHDVTPRKGYICLESEGSPVEFRNIRIKELPSTGATPEDTATLAEE